MTRLQTNPVSFRGQMFDTQALANIIANWLDSQFKGKGASLNILAGTALVIHRLVKKAPLEDSDVITSDGGQLIGGRGQHLRGVLRQYGIPDDFLSDGVTTRSTQKFRSLLSAIDYGKGLGNLTETERQIAVNELMAIVSQRITRKVTQSPLNIALSPQKSLSAQIREILTSTRERSRGRVEQHLVGAKLKQRFADQPINEQRAYAADVQTSRSGDFAIHQTVYHVTASPMPALMRKVRANLAGALHSVILEPVMDFKG